MAHIESECDVCKTNTAKLEPKKCASIYICLNDVTEIGLQTIVNVIRDITPIESPNNRRVLMHVVRGEI